MLGTGKETSKYLTVLPYKQIPYRFFRSLLCFVDRRCTDSKAQGNFIFDSVRLSFFVNRNSPPEMETSELPDMVNRDPNSLNDHVKVCKFANNSQVLSIRFENAAD